RLDGFPAGLTVPCGCRWCRRSTTKPLGRGGHGSRVSPSNSHGSDMTARQTAIAEIATIKVASTQPYLEQAGQAIFGQYVFNDEAQRAYLAKPIHRKLRRTIEGLEPFDPAIVDAVAHAVKE